MPAAVASQWRDRRRRVFQSVFQADDTVLPALPSTPSSSFTDPSHLFAGAATSSLASSLPHADPHQLGTHLGQGHPLLRPGPRRSSRRTTPEPSLQTAAQPPGDDQATYDRAWHVVTAHIALPSSATTGGSFGSVSQQSSGGRDASPDFYNAVALLANPTALLPRATRTRDILAWHVHQVRAHFSRHVTPLLASFVEDDDEGDEKGDDQGGQGVGRGQQTGRRKNAYERHMVTVMSSVRTLEAALRLYFSGFNQLLSAFSRLANASPEVAEDAERLSTRFRRDIHALVSNSASEGLMRSVKAVLVRLAGTILGVPAWDDTGAGERAHAARPAPPGPDDLNVQAARERLLELVHQLHNVGLAGERFQVLFAELMDAMMSAFVTGAFAGVWSAPESPSFPAATGTVSRSASLCAASSPCIAALDNWIENHFARLSFEVLSSISPDPHGPLPVSLADLKTYKSLALGRLAALRTLELFDIVLAWPSSRPALDDLRAAITTTARRRQLTDAFSRALKTRLLHPGCSTLEILQTYVAIIRTLHALDPSKVLLSHVEPSLQLYLCQREDAVRVVVAGLLASPEEMRAARRAREIWKRQNGKARWGGEERTKRRARDHAPFVTPRMAGTSSRSPARQTPRDSNPEAEETPDQAAEAASKDGHLHRPTKLVELALLLNDPSQTRRPNPEVDEDLDWNDMNWVPDPVDAGANYKRPKSEDVIGTLISALGSGDVFIKEFSAVVAERLLGEPARFDQELRVLDLLKRRFGEAALQNCDVMIRDVQDSRRLDAAIHKARGGPAGAASKRRRERVLPATPDKTAAVEQGGEAEEGEGGDGEGSVEYHARILSRLFWPNLDREHFLLPQPVVEQQRRYEQGYEGLKSGRKLTWLNQLGQARVELELSDRAVTVDCTPVQATVIYAFQDAEEEGGGDREVPVRKSIDQLYEQLQMDEDLIAAALQFWVGKGVLRRVPGSSCYAVIESLDDALGKAAGVAVTAPETQPTVTATTAAPGVATTAASTGRTTGAQVEAEPALGAEADAEPGARTGPSSARERERERRDMYWRYIQGMLTNASATMPLAQMAMMMRMLIADGFAWTDEELLEFLAEKVAAGEMEVVGGKYRLVKK